MKILHSSDLHGGFPSPDLQDFDVWVDSGDLCPDYDPTRAPYSASLQKVWLQQVFAPRAKVILAGRPMVLCGGNHDFANTGHILKDCGLDVHVMTPQGFDLLGYRWAGFREIPLIGNAGIWAGETPEEGLFARMLETLDGRPDIVVTHAPPADILASRWGSPGMAKAYGEFCKVPKVHFFGHIHEYGGQTLAQDGTLFVNGARNSIIHDLSDLL